jgi:hypothetical protein
VTVSFLGQFRGHTWGKGRLAFQSVAFILAKNLDIVDIKLLEFELWHAPTCASKHSSSSWRASVAAEAQENLYFFFSKKVVGRYLFFVVNKPEHLPAWRVGEERAAAQILSPPPRGRCLCTATIEPPSDPQCTMP